ncbi:MAG: dihydrodipicolinate synthase family protein [Candidatus Latescibacterota bacterium]
MKKSRYEISTFKKGLSGPVPSIMTAFLRNGAMDYDGVANQIEQAIAGGTTALLLTWGDSHFSSLKDEEIVQLNQFVIAQAKKRVMVIASGNRWPTMAAVEFANTCKKWGADLHNSLAPNWGNAGNPETFYEHYRAIGQVMPVMAMTSMAPGPPLPLATVGMLLEDVESGLVAIKDDICGLYGKRMALLVRGRCAFLSGGMKMNYMDERCYGADGYLSEFMSLCPSVAMAFWGHIQDGNIERGMEMVRDLEMPFMFDLCEEIGLDNDGLLHAAMEVFGVCGRWRRNPYQNATDQQMEKIREFLSGKNLL